MQYQKILISMSYGGNIQKQLNLKSYYRYPPSHKKDVNDVTLWSSNTITDTYIYALMLFIFLFSAFKRI